MGGGDPLREAPRFRDPDAVHRHLGLQVRPLLLGAGGIARLLQGLTQLGDELRDPRTRLPAHCHPHPSSQCTAHALSACPRRLTTCVHRHYGPGWRRRPERESGDPGLRARAQDTLATGGGVASSRGDGTMPSAVCSRGILPVGCPCVPRRSRGKAMEMSHSGLVRLPAKEVGVEAPREFESPHLRHSESPGARQRAGVSSSEHSLRWPRRLPNGWQGP